MAIYRVVLTTQEGEVLDKWNIDAPAGSEILPPPVELRAECQSIAEDIVEEIRKAEAALLRNIEKSK